MLPDLTPVRPRALGPGGPVVSPLERLGVFLVFWVRSWARVTDDVRAALDRLKAQGKVQAVGLSSHDRGLAAEAARTGWDPVMVRHSAAHRKAEAEVFPVARERGTAVITFNSTHRPCETLCPAGPFRVACNFGGRCEAVDGRRRPPPPI